MFPIAAVLAASTLQGCAAAPDTVPTYEALERGFRWQCQTSPEPDVCVHHKFLALQERRARQLTLNECAIAYGRAPREAGRAVQRRARAADDRMPQALRHDDVHDRRRQGVKKTVGDDACDVAERNASAR